MKLPVYLDLLRRCEQSLASSYRVVAEGHGDEPDVHFLCQTLASQCDQHEQALNPVVSRYGEPDASDETQRLHPDKMTETRSGPLGLLRDLQELYVLANFVDITWTMIKQAAQGERDEELLSVVTRCDGETAVQIAWLKTRMKQAAPQALIAAR